MNAKFYFQIYIRLLLFSPASPSQPQESLILWQAAVFFFPLLAKLQLYENDEGSLPSPLFIAKTNLRKSKCTNPFSWYWSWGLNKCPLHTFGLSFLSRDNTHLNSISSFSSTGLWQNCWMMTSHSTWYHVVLLSVHSIKTDANFLVSIPYHS